MMNKQRKALRQDESGLVSITVTLVIMSLLTLMAIGFSNISNREQRQALDQQLNTQAFYAAESGINDAVHALNNGTPVTSNCTPTPVNPLDPSVATTCVSVNPEPKSLEYSEVSTDGSIIVPIQPKHNINSITISWQDSNNKTVFASNSEHNLLSQSDWLTWETTDNRTGLIRAMLMPGSFSDRNDLIARTQTLLLYPSGNAATANVLGEYTVPTSDGFTKKGEFVDGNCNTGSSPKFCNAKININIAANEVYYLRLKAIYAPVSITILAGGGNGNRIELLNAQTEIDSTGRTSDVLRRLKVKVPSAANPFVDGEYPEFAVETVKGLCKRMKVVPGEVPEYDTTPPSGAQSSEFDNAICQN